ncbi:MAG: biopolymer transporter ExbD [Deltaproteobacteria bacterium]|nr:biopolymer transporter ExbD [Deltaproteobacteria bacterium]
MVFRKKKREEEAINPTPLVDVMFNLLIFIIITAQYTNIQALKVNLPKSQVGTQIEKTEKIVIGVTQQEEIFLNERPVDMSGLEAALAPLGKKQIQPAVFIQADEGSTTGKLVTIMDLVSKAGLNKISIETKK